MQDYFIASKIDRRHLVKHAMFIVTDDAKKDANAVNKFEDLAIENLMKEMDHNLTVLHEFTDGCASQYKRETMPFGIFHSEKN